MELDSVHLYIRQERDQTLRTQSTEAGVYLGYEFAQDGRPVFFYLHLEAQIKGLHHSPTFDAQKVAEGFHRVDLKREHIQIPALGRADYRFGVVVLQGFDLEFTFLGSLEVQIFGTQIHFSLICLDDIVNTSAQKADNLVDVAFVFQA